MRAKLYIQTVLMLYEWHHKTLNLEKHAACCDEQSLLAGLVLAKSALVHAKAHVHRIVTTTRLNGSFS
jgi:hypothetical protein